MRSAWEQPIEPRDPAQIRSATHAILAQAQFRPPRQTLPQRVEHWIAQKLSSLFSGGGGGGPSLLHAVVVAILVALVVVVLVVIARQGGFRRGRRPQTRRSPAVMVSADDLGLSDDAWLARAVAAEETGDGREGVRCRYRALVAVLVSAGAVGEEIGRTAGEYRRLVERTVPEAATSFVAATETFEEVWYGQVPVGAEQRDVLIAAAPPVTEAARRYRRSNRRDAEVDRTQTVGTGSDR
ncbi:MAG: DUF4129 domain-containing protein [Actinomycetota bacterium]|nr:DUF4129 domain-containing protein [Actinomycetota bacterium]